MQSTYYATYTGCNFLYSLNGDGYKKEEGQKEEEGEEEGETSQRKKIKNTGKKKIGISFEDWSAFHFSMASWNAILPQLD